MKCGVVRKESIQAAKTEEETTAVDGFARHERKASYGSSANGWQSRGRLAFGRV